MITITLSKLKMPVLIALCVILAVLYVSTTIRKSLLAKEINQAKNMIQKTQGELNRLYESEDKLTKDNDKLKADAVSYLSINNKLQAEKDGVLKKQEEMQKSLAAKEEEIKKLAGETADLKNKLETRTSDKPGFEKENEELKKKIANMDATLNKERALFHYNLGVLFAEERQFDKAIHEYLAALKLNQDLADANYNLAVLYDNYKEDQIKALPYYRRYLELKPDAKEKSEIEALLGD